MKRIHENYKQLKRADEVLIGFKICDIPGYLNRANLLLNMNGYSYFSQVDLTPGTLREVYK